MRQSGVKWTVTAALVAYAVLAVARQQAEVAPERPAPAWRGPSPAALIDAADRGVDRALSWLNDSSLTASDRLGGYRKELVGVESLLKRSLEARPDSAGGMARLAAVGWELSGGADAEVARARMRQAADMAPMSADVQRRLGDLSLRMGERVEAARYLRRSVELAPASARQVVRLLREHAVSATELLDTLGRGPAVLLAAADAFVEDGLDGVYAAEVGRVLDAEAAEPELMRAYVSACHSAGRPTEARDTLSRIGVLDGDEREASRLNQLARTWVAAGELDQALARIVEARRLRPEAPDLAGHQGDVEARAGRLEQAVAAYREALGLVARAEGNPRARARLYARIGQVQEQRGEPGLAYDAYRMAVGLVPDEPVAAARLAAMERAAGVRPAYSERETWERR